jgi:hypothetical protein
MRSNMTAATNEPPNERVSHADKVGSVEDLGTLAEMPRRSNNLVPGRVRQYNPFDPLVVETYQTGKPRLAVADDLESAKVLIRRAAEHAGFGVDVVATVAPDGRDAVAYLARDKRPKVTAPTPPGAPTATPAETEAEGMASYDDDPDDEPGVTAVG